MRGFHFNVSSLFSNLRSDSAFGSFNFSDYASIKNGSYGKLLKAYYGEQKKATANNKTSTKSSEREEITDKTGLTQLKREADELKSATEALGSDALWKQTDGKYDMDKITGAVKSFVGEYNDTITQAWKVNTKDIAKDVSSMSSMTNTMSKMLSKVGVTVGVDGKLSVNEEELKKANVASIKALFTGTVSYGSQIADRASEIAKDTVKSSSIYGKTGTLSSPLNNMFDKWI